MKKSIAYGILLLVLVFLDSCTKAEIEKESGKLDIPNQLILYSADTKGAGFELDGL